MRPATVAQPICVARSAAFRLRASEAALKAALRRLRLRYETTIAHRSEQSGQSRAFASVPGPADAALQPRADQAPAEERAHRDGRERHHEQQQRRPARAAAQPPARRRGRCRARRSGCRAAPRVGCGTAPRSRRLRAGRSPAGQPAWQDAVVAPQRRGRRGGAEQAARSRSGLEACTCGTSR